MKSGRRGGKTEKEGGEEEKKEAGKGRERGKGNRKDHGFRPTSSLVFSTAKYNHPINLTD